MAASGSACSATAPSAARSTPCSGSAPTRRALSGRRPEIAGVLTRIARRLRGDPRGLRADRRADRRDRTGARVCAARAAGRSHVVTANKQLLSHHGEELFETRPRARRAAGLRGGRGRRRARRAGARESLAGDARSSASTASSTARPTSSSPRWRTAPLRAGARRGAAPGYAEADPSDDVGGRDAAAKMAILARLAFGSPVHLDDVRYEGIEHLTIDDIAVRARAGLGLKLIGTAERRGGGISVRVHPDLPLRRASARLGRRLVQRGHGRVRGDHRDHDVGARRGRLADRQRRARRRRQRDDRRRRPPAPPLQLELVEDVVTAFYVQSTSTIAPACWRRCERSASRCLDQVGRPARQRRARAADDGDPSAAESRLRAALGRSRDSIRALAAARDPRDRRGVL